MTNEEATSSAPSSTFFRQAAREMYSQLFSLYARKYASRRLPPGTPGIAWKEVWKRLKSGSGGDGASASFSSVLSSVSSSQQQISASLLQVSASYISLSGSYTTFSGSASTRITENSSSIQQVSASQQQISASLLNVISIFATTGSNSFRADQSITGSLVVSSTITAQTLVVQTVTSSIVYSSGSNIFGRN